MRFISLLLTAACFTATVSVIPTAPAAAQTPLERCLARATNGASQRACVFKYG